MNFNDLNLDPIILSAVEEAGYSTPTQIQQEAIPAVLQGLDLRASAQTGTGKTAAFVLPALTKLCTPSPKQGKGARILILTPTRELAMQVAGQVQKYSKYMKRLNIVTLYGGVPYHKQSRQLDKYVDVMIATPGRLIDFIDRKKVDLSRLEMLVLDEADRMLDMGFLDPVKEIVSHTPKQRQTLLFSATLDKSIQELSNSMLRDPKNIEIHARHQKHENILQKLHYADNLKHKNEILSHLLLDKDLNSAIVFTSTKRHASLLALDLKKQGHKAEALHGDMNQRQRTRTIDLLKRGKINILVATDVAARGIDVQTITHVINFDLPRNIEDYVHRIGRTGRASATGTAYSLATVKEAQAIKKIEQFTGQEINIVEISGLEPQIKTKPLKVNKKSRFKKSAKKPFASSKFKKPKFRFGGKK